MSAQCADGKCAVPMIIDNAVEIDTCQDRGQCVKIDKCFADSPVPISAETPESSELEIARKLCAEALGTCVLVTVIVGSGIMAQTLSPRDVGLQLLENAVSVGGGLIGLILMFGPVSGG